MIDAYQDGMDVYNVSVMIEVLAKNEDEAADYADRRLITDSVVSDPKLVSFSISTANKTRQVFE